MKRLSQCAKPMQYKRENDMFGLTIRVVISIFLEPGSEVWNQKRVKTVSMCESDATREVNMFGSAIQVVISVFLKLGTEV